MQQMSDTSAGSRYACADPHLVSVSFFSPEAVQAAGARLLEAGLIEAEENAYQEFAVVDQHFGPMLPCPWLEWEKDSAGYTSAWLVGAPTAPLVVPEAWTIEQSLRLTRADFRDEPGRAMKLADEHGIETWIDFATGRITSGLPQRVTPEHDLPEPAGNDLSAVVRSALDDFGFPYDYSPDASGFHMVLPGTHCMYDCAITADPSTFSVKCYLGAALRMKRGSRLAICETITRANYGLRIGNFEFDLDDGEVRYKTSLDIEGGVLTPKMVQSLVMAACAAFDTYYPALMRVLFGNVKPKDAVAEAEAKR